MTIEEKDFKLTAISDSDLLFDVELLYTIKGKTERTEFKVAAYGVSLEHALKKIAQYRVSKKLETTTLKEYIETFKEEVNKLEKLCK
jgi:hypothetical protein